MHYLRLLFVKFYVFRLIFYVKSKWYGLLYIFKCRGYQKGSEYMKFYDLNSVMKKNNNDENV